MENRGYIYIYIYLLLRLDRQTSDNTGGYNGRKWDALGYHMDRIETTNIDMIFGSVENEGFSPNI